MTQSHHVSPMHATTGDQAEEKNKLRRKELKLGVGKDNERTQIKPGAVRVCGPATAVARFEERLQRKANQYQSTVSLRSSMPPQRSLAMGAIQSDATYTYRSQRLISGQMPSCRDVLEDKIQAKIKEENEKSLRKSVGEAPSLQTAPSVFRPKRRESRRLLLDSKLERHRSSLMTSDGADEMIRSLSLNEKLGRRKTSLGINANQSRHKSNDSFKDVVQEELGRRNNLLGISANQSRHEAIDSCKEVVHDKLLASTVTEGTAHDESWSNLDDVIYRAQVMSLSSTGFDPPSVNVDP